jgi:hypothetical protein
MRHRNDPAAIGAERGAWDGRTMTMGESGRSITTISHVADAEVADREYTLHAGQRRSSATGARPLAEAWLIFSWHG